MANAGTKSPDITRPLWRYVADRMAAQYLEKGVSRLPTIAVLAGHFGVSKGTIKTARRFLIHKGLLGAHTTPHNDTTGEVAHTPAGPYPARRTAIERTAALIKGRIARGEYRSGDVLPKVNDFTVAERVSEHSVVQAFGVLVKSSVIHKCGRRFVVGPAPGGQSSRLFQSKPFIVIVVCRPQDWEGLCVSERTCRFGEEFTAEADRMNVHLRRARLDPPRKPVEAAIPGMNETLNSIAASPHLYRGCLVTVPPKEMPSIDGWIRKLLILNRPVVWFDRVGDLGDPPEIPGGLVRCFTSERRCVGEAVDFLQFLGHRHVGYNMRINAGWELGRWRAIQRACLEHDPPLIPVCQHNDRDGIDELAADLERLSACGCLPRVRRALDYFAKNNKELSRQWGTYMPDSLTNARFAGFFAWRNAILKGDAQLPLAGSTLLNILFGALGLPFCAAGDGVTAILSSSDQFAYGYTINFLRDLGLAVPSTVSVLSFDNRFRFTKEQLSTVDFGFGGLGYAAFHAIMQDIPVDMNRNHEIIATPRVIDRGTLGYRDSGQTHQDAVGE